MVDIVGAETGPDELLEQIRLFVRSFGGTEAGQRLGALLVADFDEALGGDVERFFPGSFAEVRERIGRIDLVVGILLRRSAAAPAAWSDGWGDGCSRSRSDP